MYPFEILIVYIACGSGVLKSDLQSDFIFEPNIEEFNELQGTI